MKINAKTIEINGVKYVPESEVNMSSPAEKLNGMEYVIVRSKDAGVHAGYLKDKAENSVSLVNSRRIWYWSGAASISQIATEGVKKPKECKFSVVVNRITVLGVCEILYCTESAKNNIIGVPEWKS